MFIVVVAFSCSTIVNIFLLNTVRLQKPDKYGSYFKQSSRLSYIIMHAHIFVFVCLYKFKERRKASELEMFLKNDLAFQSQNPDTALDVHISNVSVFQVSVCFLTLATVRVHLHVLLITYIFHFILLKCTGIIEQGTATI